MSARLSDAWRRSHEANQLLLSRVADEDLECRYSERTRTVAAQFAHLVNVRVHHLEARGKSLLGDLAAFARGAQPSRAELLAALAASAEAVAGMLEACESEGGVKGWRGPPATFLAYLVAHEAHHRALAVVSLRLSGRKLPRDVLQNVWNWGKRGPL